MRQAILFFFCCRSTTVGNVSHYFDPPSVRVSCGFSLLEYVLLRLNAQQKEGREYHDMYVGTYRFLNEVSPARRSQLAAAVCTEQPTPEVASGGDKASART